MPLFVGVWCWVYVCALLGFEGLNFWLVHGLLFVCGLFGFLFLRCCVGLFVENCIVDASILWLGALFFGCWVACCLWLPGSLFFFCCGGFGGCVFCVFSGFLERTVDALVSGADEGRG